LISWYLTVLTLQYCDSDLDEVLLDMNLFYWEILDCMSGFG
jgi:hypothetical protein